MLTDTIEDNAVNAVKIALNNTGVIDAGYITSKDRKPSWDGDVLIYDNPYSRKKRNIKKVDVQVKGMEREIFPTSSTKESVAIDDLKNYAENGGAIYFVVYLNSNDEKKIYYQTLTPVKIYAILRAARGEKTTKVEFLAFPSDKREIINIFQNFYDNSKRQASFTPDNMLSIEELKTGRDITELTISMFGYGERPSKMLLTNEAYLYAKKTGTKVLIPFNAFPKTIYLEHNVDIKLTVNGVPFPQKVSIFTTRNGDEIKIGDTISFPMQANKPITINYKFSRFLRKRITDTSFMIAAVKANGFELNGIRLEMNLTEEERTRFNLQATEEHIKVLSNIQKALDCLHIKKDIDITKLTDREWRWLDHLVTAFVKNEKVAGWKEDVERVAKLIIQNITILLTFDQDKKDRSAYTIRDFFEPNFVIVYGDASSDDRFVAPVFSSLTANDYNMFDNIDYDTIVSRYDEILKQNPRLTEKAVIDVLSLISAYDDSGRVEQLETAQNLLNWIVASNKIKTEVDLINELQITKRKRELTEGERTELMNLVENKDTAEDIKVGAYLLLGEQSFAKQHLCRLTKEEQQKFETYPIYKKFWRKD